MRLRLAGFAVVFAAVAFLIVRIDANIWRAQVRPEEGFAAIKAEKFYFGVNFRVTLRKLSDSLLDYHLTANPADLESFRREAHELQTWLSAKQARFVAQNERNAFLKLEAAYLALLGRADPRGQINGSLPAGAEGFPAAYARLKQDYRPIHQECPHSPTGPYPALLTPGLAALAAPNGA